MYELTKLEELGLDWLVYHDTEKVNLNIQKDELG